MRLAFWVVFSVVVTLVCACGSPEQPPAKPPTPVAAAPAQPPAAPPPAVTPPAAPKPAAPAAAEAAKPVPAPAAVKAAPAPAAPKAAAPAKPPAVADTLVLPASQGKVTLHHLTHAKQFPCAACHTETTPGKLNLTKETAHALCRDCHQAKGAGPTGCSGCHQK